jgi:Co/Zn/Cd efflux system component
MTIFVFWVIGAAGFYALTGQMPSAPLMSSIGYAALAPNLTSTLVLFLFRAGDSNRRSVWLCKRNDAVSKVAVIAAGGAVFATNTGWPDTLVGVVVGILAQHSAHQVITLARHVLTTA